MSNKTPTRGKQKKRERNEVTDESNDRGYFVVTPRLVWAFSRNPFDYTLWNVVKGIAGDRGQCILDTPQLATLAMMSGGQVSDSREWLLAVGLFRGKPIKDVGYPYPVWHLTIPDLWQTNVEWSQQFSEIAARIAFKEQQKYAVKKLWALYKKVKKERKANGQWEYDQVIEVFHQVKQSKTVSLYETTVSPGEKYPTPGEKYPTPGERKKIQKEDPERRSKRERRARPKAKKEQGVKAADPLLTHPAVVAYRDVMRLTPNAVQRAEIAAVVGNNGHVEDWREVLRVWQLCGYKPSNVAGQLDKFKKQTAVGGGHESATGNASGSAASTEPTPDQQAAADRINAARAARQSEF